MDGGNNPFLYRLRAYLDTRHPWLRAFYIGLICVGVYSCMYGFRKPFTAASFDHLTFLGIHYKAWLVTAQVAGYMLSKFYGIRFIAENRNQHKPVLIFKLIVIAWLSLFFFALIEAPYNILFLVINGFPLGIIWGLVFSYVEGRLTAEYIGAILASSFIFASGLAKTIGTWLMWEGNVQESWMPFVAGSWYLIPLAIFCLLLYAIPPPTSEDVSFRTARQPMDTYQRKAFIQEYLPGLAALILAYILLTILRDFRDNFAAELMNEIGLAGQASLFTATELLVTVGVLIGCMGLMFIRDNFKAFIVNHIMIMSGLVLVLISTWLYHRQILSPFLWFICTGLGLYLSYIPINCFYFERMIAAFRLTANVGFVMYLADAYGYLGSVAVLALKEFSGVELSWLSFFTQLITVGCTAGIIFCLFAILFYQYKYKRQSLLVV
jgi:MFS family permease